MAIEDKKILWAKIKDISIQLCRPFKEAEYWDRDNMIYEREYLLRKIMEDKE